MLKVAAYDSFDHSAEASVTVNVANEVYAGIDGGSTGRPAADSEPEHHDPVPSSSCAAGSSTPQPYGLLALLLLDLGPTDPGAGSRARRGGAKGLTRPNQSAGWRLRTAPDPLTSQASSAALPQNTPLSKGSL